MSIDWSKYTRNRIIYDDFTRANGNLTTPWTQFNSNWGNITIDANKVRGSASAPGGDATTTAMARYTGRQWHRDQYAEIMLDNFAFQSNGYHMGTLVRGSSAHPTETCYWAFVDSDSAGPTYGTRFGKTVNGTDTVWTDKNLPWASGDTIGLEVIGNELRVLKNGEYINDPDFYRQDNDLTDGDPGIIASGNSGLITGDNWLAGEMVTIDPEHKIMLTPRLRTRTSRPPPGTPIDLNHPLARGITFMHAFNSPEPSYVAGEYSTSITNTPEFLGNRMKFDRSVVECITYTLSTGEFVDGGTTSEWLLMVGTEFITENFNGNAILAIGNGGLDRGLLMRQFSATNDTLLGMLTGPNSTVTTDNFQPVAPPARFSFAFRRLSGACSVHINGYDVTATDGISNSDLSATYEDLIIGGDDDQGNGLDGYLDWVIVLKGAHTDQEIRELHRNPWQIFEPEPMPIFVKPDKKLVTFR